MVKEGAVLRDTNDKGPWNILVVVSINGDVAECKRPYTHVGKSFIQFEPVMVGLPLQPNYNVVRA